MNRQFLNACSTHAAAAKSLQSYPTLCDPIDSGPPGSPIPGILQARTLEWVAISFSNTWKWKVKVKSLSHVWLFWDPMVCSPPGSSVHGIFQARILEWGAIAAHIEVCKPVTITKYQFPVAVVTNYYKLNDVKQHKCIILQFWGRKSRRALMGLKPSGGRAVVPRRFQGEAFSFPSRF